MTLLLLYRTKPRKTPKDLKVLKKLRISYQKLISKNPLKTSIMNLILILYFYQKTRTIKTLYMKTTWNMMVLKDSLGFQLCTKLAPNQTLESIPIHSVSLFNFQSNFYLSKQKLDNDLLIMFLITLPCKKVPSCLNS